MIFFTKKFSEGYILSGEIVLLKSCLPSFPLSFYLYIFQLQDYVEYIGSHARVILVPSMRDANHDFVFPQVCSC